MKKNLKPTVQNGRLQIPSNRHEKIEEIPVASDLWFTWLNVNTRFIFVGENGRFTARKEVRRDQDYWYAYRRREGKLKKAYLGRSGDLSLRCLQKADAKLAGKETQLPLSIDAFETSLDREETAVLQPVDLASTTFINSKFQPPQQPENVLKRPHLYHQLTTTLNFIHAPSGFGKRTLLTHWMEATDKPVAWVSLEATDNDPVRFWVVITTAIHSLWPTRKLPLQRLPPTPEITQIQEMITHLINAIAENKLLPFALILDGYHFITQSLIHEAIRFFIHHLPKMMQLLISSDTQLPFSLSQWRAGGIVTELTIEDLRLSLHEGVQFLQAQPGTQLLAYAEMQALVRQTNGWTAGLHLASLALKRQVDLSYSVGELIGESEYFNEFFVENVLIQQETAVQQFLLQTSILKRLTADLCDAVTEQENSKQLLDRLWRSNLFLTKLGGEPAWYQYHPLFTAVLNQQLQQQVVSPLALHQRAVQWYQANDAPAEAVHHLLAMHAWEDAAALIESVASRELHEKGEDSRLLRWVLQLPVAVVQQHRALLGTYIRLTNLALSRSHQEKFLKQVEENILKKPAFDLSSDEEIVLKEVQYFRQRMATGQAISPSESGLSYGADDPFALTDTYLQGIHAFNVQDFPRAEALITQVLEEAEARGNLFLILLAGGAFAFSQLLQGRLRASETIAQQILRDVYERAGRWPEPSSLSFMVLAMIAYERHLLPEAQKWLEKASDVDPNPTSANLPMMGHVLQARIQTAQGEFEAAHATLRAAFHLNPDMRSMAWTKHDLMLWQTWVYAREGELMEAEQLLASVRAEVEPNTAVIQSRDLHRIVLAEVQLAKNEFEQAELLLTQWLSDYPYGFRNGSIMDPMIMLVAALFAQNKVNRAQKLLEKTVRIASSEKQIRPFLERGPQILSLLVLIAESGRLTSETRQFTQQLINMIRETTGLDLPSSLEEFATLTIVASISERELEVLRLVSNGLSNQAIAFRMMITVSTVNTHLKHIYKKLDVHNRTEAVLRAQELKLSL